MYVLNGKIIETNLVGMKTLLEYLSTNYSTDLLSVAGDGTNLQTDFQIQAANINTLITMIQNLLGTYPTMTWSYYKQ